MAALVGKGIAAFLCSVMAYIYIRWRANVAAAGARVQWQIASHMPRYTRVPLFWSQRFWLVHGIAIALLLSVFSVVLWGMFFLELFGLLPTQASGLLAEEGAPLVESAESRSRGTCYMLISAVLFAFGIHTIVRGRRWARLDQGLHSTELPTQPKAAKRGGLLTPPPSRRWVAGTIIWGTSALAAGAVFLWLGIRELL